MKYIFTIIGTMLLLSSCNTNRSDEENIQRLLDSQAEIEEAQEQSLERLEEIKDSLAVQRKSLLKKRDSTDQQIREMERDQLFLANQLKEVEASEITETRSELEHRVKTYQDSISLLKGELFDLNNQLDSVERNISIFQIQEERSEERLESGISEIDQEMERREIQKQQALKRLDLLRKRSLVADKKMEAFQMERQMYADELDALLRENASDTEKAPFQARISEMDSTLGIQQAHKKALQEEISEAQTFIAETDAFLNEMEDQIKEEYDKNAVIESFIAAEKQRLMKELQEIQATRQSLLNEQSQVANDLASTEQQIALLDRDLELIRNREMSDLLELQADIEKSEASLAEEEIGLIEDEEGRVVRSSPSDSASEEMISVISMGNQLDSLNELIQQEKAEIAKTRRDLAERRSEAAEKRATFGRALGITILLLAIAGIGLLTLFYFLGRKSRR
jgi:chromosome segregation ATPase